MNKILYVLGSSDFKPLYNLFTLDKIESEYNMTE